MCRCWSGFRTPIKWYQNKLLSSHLQAVEEQNTTNKATSPKSPKIEKSNLFIYFSLFFSMLKFFSCRLNKFFPGSFGRKRIGSGTLWNFSWPAATRNSKIGFPRQFFLPYEPVKNFSHGKKKFSHCKKRKINEQSTIDSLWVLSFLCL